MTCNPIILRDAFDGTELLTVWCRTCEWESEPTQSIMLAQLRAKQHKEGDSNESV